MFYFLRKIDFSLICNLKTVVFKTVWKNDSFQKHKKLIVCANSQRFCHCWLTFKLKLTNKKSSIVWGRFGQTIPVLTIVSKCVCLCHLYYNLKWVFFNKLPTSKQEGFWTPPLMCVITDKNTQVQTHIKRLNRHSITPTDICTFVSSWPNPFQVIIATIKCFLHLIWQFQSVCCKLSIVCVFVCGFMFRVNH